MGENLSLSSSILPEIGNFFLRYRAYICLVFHTLINKRDKGQHLLSISSFCLIFLPLERKGGCDENGSLACIY